MLRIGTGPNAPRPTFFQDLTRDGQVGVIIATFKEEQTRCHERPVVGSMAFIAQEVTFHTDPVAATLPFLCSERIEQGTGIGDKRECCTFVSAFHPSGRHALPATIR